MFPEKWRKKKKRRKRWISLLFRYTVSNICLLTERFEIRKRIGYVARQNVLWRQDHSIQNENQRNWIMGILDANGFKWQDRISTWKVDGKEMWNGEKIGCVSSRRQCGCAIRRYEYVRCSQVNGNNFKFPILKFILSACVCEWVKRWWWWWWW